MVNKWSLRPASNSVCLFWIKLWVFPLMVHEYMSIGDCRKLWILVFLVWPTLECKRRVLSPVGIRNEVHVNLRVSSNSVTCRSCSIVLLRPHTLNAIIVKMCSILFIVTLRVHQHTIRRALCAQQLANWWNPRSWLSTLHGAMQTSEITYIMLVWLLVRQSSIRVSRDVETKNLW